MPEDKTDGSPQTVEELEKRMEKLENKQEKLAFRVRLFIGFIVLSWYSFLLLSAPTPFIRGIISLSGLI
ncbi:MAG: hypothetical protein ACYCPW_12780, partial [Nitrososphaerales archaeon]